MSYVHVWTRDEHVLLMPRATHRRTRDARGGGRAHPRLSCGSTDNSTATRNSTARRAAHRLARARTGAHNARAPPGSSRESAATLPTAVRGERAACRPSARRSGGARQQERSVVRGHRRRRPQRLMREGVEHAVWRAAAAVPKQPAEVRKLVSCEGVATARARGRTWQEGIASAPPCTARAPAPASRESVRRVARRRYAGRAC